MILGIDLGGTNVRAGAVDGGRLVNKISEPSRAELPVKESVEHIKSVIGKVFSSAVTGIGVGVPSVVDVERGIVYNVVNIPSWKEVHLKAELEREFGVPVHVNNDANCFALGEKVFGVAKGYDDVVGVTLGTGVGAGLVFDGKLYSGRNCGAGELSSVPYLSGNYEHFCSSEFFIDEHRTTGKECAAAARAGDAAARAIWAEYGAHVGRFMWAVLYAYDPQCVVFGGGIASAWDLWGDAMEAVLREFQYAETVKNLKVAVSDNPDIAILGAAALVL